MLLSRVWRLLDVDRRLFCTLEYLIAQYVVEATELSLRVNNDPLYVCSILFVVNVVTMRHFIVITIKHHTHHFNFKHTRSFNAKERGTESQQLI